MTMRDAGFPDSAPADVDEACRAAASAFLAWSRTSRADRGAVLGAMADALAERADEIVAVAGRETNLGEVRLRGELVRTCFQMRFFAEVIAEGSYLEVAIDHAADTPMGPRPDLRRMLLPLGPVAVFGASNFPLAFSVPGGDTVSALAAGCTVVVKAHPAHPLTSLLCFEAMSSVAPAGVLQLVSGQQAGRDLVEHPDIRAVGFTGSVAGGQALAGLAAARPAPIPFYGELGSVNTVIVTPEAARVRGEQIGAGLGGSFTLGSGQFCTKPGLAFIPSGKGGDALRDACVAAIRDATFAMLTDGIRASYVAGAAALAAEDGLRDLLDGASALDDPARVGATLLELDVAADLPDRPELLHEVFGPLALLVRYEALEDLTPVLGALPGALTATVHAEADEPGLMALSERLQAVAGRLVWNGYPTGVAVSWAQHHGGPWPGTNSLHTSVGATSLRRFLRPVALQDAPVAVLPVELRDGPSPVPRRVDGILQLGTQSTD
ncbi:aldehyde dehydrogenase (NADP(+)) [Acidothermaceae bacterium B102]|nr:aldehyde dehydrogenase (NADP(+)) [Acidothermaceae bacterium B102]